MILLSNVRLTLIIILIIICCSKSILVQEKCSEVEVKKNELQRFGDIIKEKDETLDKRSKDTITLNDKVEELLSSVCRGELSECSQISKRLYA